VLVAQALVHRPPVIVLDEPTAGVDVELRQTLWAFVRELNAAGHAIVLTTHYLEEAQELCSRIAMMKAGRIVALDETARLLAAFSERCQLSATPCDDAMLAEVWRQLQQELPPDHYDELSFFEITTLLAFQLFQQKAADFQVLEVGLGGRWDATNVSDPLVSALVSVSKDHQEYLGSDVIGIMNEKLGIMRPGRPLFWGRSGEVCEVPGYHEQLLQQTAKQNVPLYEADRDFGYDEASETIAVNLPNLPLCSLPVHKLLKKTPLFLRRNLALAAAMYHYLQQTLGDEKWKPLHEIWPLLCEGQAPAPVTLYGRSQRLKVPSARGPVRLILDLSHNPDGAQAF